MLTMFFAFIVIALILAAFVFVSGIARLLVENKGGMIVMDEDDVEIGSMVDYMDEYVKLAGVKVLVDDDVSFKEAAAEVGYE